MELHFDSICASTLCVENTMETAQNLDPASCCTAPAGRSLQWAGSGRCCSPECGEGRVSGIRRRCFQSTELSGQETRGPSRKSLSWGVLSPLCLRFYFHTSALPTFPRTLISNEFPSLHSPSASHELYSEICL